MLFRISSTSRPSVDKVDTEKVQQQASKDEVRKCALMRDILKVRLVLRVCLDAKRGSEDELAHCSAEAAEEGVEWLFAKEKKGTSLANKQ